MGKPGREVLLDFKARFDRTNRELGKRQFLTYYLMAAHPGCTDEHMKELSAFCRKRLWINPEQIQVFSPTPSTFSALMYCTGRDWETGEEIFVERSWRKKTEQKFIVLKPKKKNGSSGKGERPALRHRVPYT